MRRLCLLLLMYLAAGAVVGSRRDVRAAAPGVPALPTAAADYVGYAVTNLPTHFKSGVIATLNNTPANNPISNAGATLGRVLFYDDRLSHNDSTSCASCHQQQTGFSDPNQFSTGFLGGLTGRHSMALVNSAYYQRGRFFWDERAATLEDQVLMPIQNEVEMGSTLTELTAKLSSTAFYPTLFQNAFGTPEVTPDRISKALAQFVRSIKSYGSKFDQAIAAGTPANPNYSAFTAQELLGKEIFHNSGACNQCHTTNAQVGDVPRNIGLDATITDVGAGNGRFKVPTLRDVALRGRFMHDGRFTSLEQVIDFYSTGIQYSSSLDSRLVVDGHARQFNFTVEEKDALIAFLNTLTDESVATNGLFTNPFVSLPGDFNGDGVVDAADLAVWSTSIAAGDGGGDADDDGDTDGADLLAWQRDLGMSWTDLAIPSGVGSVPEPTTILQLGICATTLVAVARRGSRDPRRNCQST